MAPDAICWVRVASTAEELGLTVAIAQIKFCRVWPFGGMVKAKFVSLAVC